MPDPIGKSCGARNVDASKCKPRDYPSCADFEEKDATFESFTLSRGKLVVLEDGKTSRQFVPPFYLIRRIDSAFWLGHPGVSGVCREAHEKAPAITKAWKLYTLPSTVKPIASAPEPKASPEIEAVEEFAEPLQAFLRPFERAYKDLYRGDYEGAWDELGTEQRTGLGVLGGLMVLGGALLGAKRRARKKREAREKELELAAAARERKSTLKSEAVVSPPGVRESRASISGSEQTVGIEHVLREDGALDTRLSAVYSGRGTMPSAGTNMGRFSTLPSTDEEASNIESLSRAAWLRPEHSPLVMEALESLHGDVGGMTVRESYERGIGIKIPMRLWKIATLLVLRCYPESEESLGRTIGAIMKEAAVGRKSFGTTEMVRAAQKLSGVAINQHDASALIFPYREWIVDDDVMEPYANKSMRRVDDRDLPPFSRDVMREFEKMRETGRAFIPREEALHLLESEEGRMFMEQAEMKYDGLPPHERERMSLAEYTAYAAVVRGKVESVSSTPVEGLRREEEKERRGSDPVRTRRDVMLPTDPMEIARETMRRAKK